MSLAFICAKQDEQGPDRTHKTSIAMKRCPRCRKHAVAGYWCEEEGCEHQEGASASSRRASRDPARTRAVRPGYRLP